VTTFSPRLFAFYARHTFESRCWARARDRLTASPARRRFSTRVDRAIAARGPRAASRRVAARLGGARESGTESSRTLPRSAGATTETNENTRAATSRGALRSTVIRARATTVHIPETHTRARTRTHTYARIHVHGDGPPDSPNLFFCFSSLHLFSRSRLSSAGSSFLRRRAVSPLCDLTKTSAPARDAPSPRRPCSSLERSFSSSPFAYLRCDV